MNTISSLSNRPHLGAARASASQFVSSFDTGTLADMGDRSLDLETHTYSRPRRRSAGQQNVVRRARLPFPEPRLPEMGMADADRALPLCEVRVEGDLRQVEENAGLGIFRCQEREDSSTANSLRPAPRAIDSQGVATLGAAPPESLALRRAFATQSFVLGPAVRETFIATQPAFDPDRPEPVKPASGTAVTEARGKAEEPSFSGPRFASLEENIARISRQKAARLAVLAIGVSKQAICKVDRLADVLRERHARRVRVLAAEHLEGLKLSSSLMGNAAGEVCLVACQARTPRKMLPFLSQFDAVILMVEIGETPVDEAADWADAIRRFEIPIVGVWAA